MHRKRGRRKPDFDASDSELSAQPMADGQETEMQVIIGAKYAMKEEDRRQPTRGRLDAKQTTSLHHTARPPALAGEIVS